MAQGQKRNLLVNPLAARAMEQFKFEIASELGIQPPKSGYWGEMTTRDTGSIGGNMVRRMVQDYQNRLVSGQITPGQVSEQAETGMTGGTKNFPTDGGPSNTHY